MWIQGNFEQRSGDINEISSLLEFILSIESHKNSGIKHPHNGSRLFVTQEMHCAFKGLFLLLLYNIVESTVCDCLNKIYDTIADEELTYGELSDDMKKMWRNSLRRAKDPNVEKTDAELSSIKVIFKELAVNISGSLDIRKIFEVFSKHGCTLDATNRENYAESFLTVKSKRNTLAHGNISFSHCGSMYVIENLKKMKSDVLSFLQEVVRQTGEFIDNQGYAHH